MTLVSELAASFFFSPPSGKSIIGQFLLIAPHGLFERGYGGGCKHVPPSTRPLDT